LRIGLLNNLRAGRSSKQVSRLLQFLRAHPNVVSVETDRAHAVPEALAELARQEVDLLVLNGGDGTLQFALTEILENDIFPNGAPMIAPLRGGRTNMSASDLGAHRDPLKGLAALLEAERSGILHAHYAPRHVMRVEYGPGKNVLCGMFFGGGLIYRAIELVHRVFPSHQQGVFGATLVTAALASRIAAGDREGVLVPNKAQVLLDGDLAEHGEYALMISSTLTQLFARMRPFWGSGEGGVRFTSIASNSSRKGQTIPGILRGYPSDFAVSENGYTSRNVDCAEMRMDCGFTVDGELVPPLPGRQLSITAHRNVRFLRA
jgi:diacylglycerol kinase (ATP)